MKKHVTCIGGGVGECKIRKCYQKRGVGVEGDVKIWYTPKTNLTTPKPSLPKQGGSPLKEVQFSLNSMFLNGAS